MLSDNFTPTAATGLRSLLRQYEAWLRDGAAVGERRR